MDDPSESIEYTADDVFRTAVIFELVLGLLALLLGWLVGPDARRLLPDLEAAGWVPVAKGCFYGLLASLPILAVIEVMKKIPWKPFQELEHLADEGMLKTLLSLSPGELVAISLCAGVGEELLFRGWLLPWMAGGTLESPPLELGAAVIGSSIAFGLVHPITKLYAVIAALMGLYFAVLLLWSGNLLVPIVAHATYDAAQLLLTSYQTRRRDAQAAS